MKKYIILLVLINTFFSCSSQSTDFEGKWYLKDNLNNSITISKNGGSYIFEENGKKYPAIIKDKMLEINAGLTVKAVIQNEILILNGKEYLNKENADILMTENKIKEGKELINPELKKLNNLFTERSDLSIFIAKKLGKDGKSIEEILSKNKDYYNSILLDEEENILSYFKKIKEDEKEITNLFITLERFPNIKTKQVVKSKLIELESIENKINIQSNKYNEILNNYKNVLKFPFLKNKEKKEPKVDFKF